MQIERIPGKILLASKIGEEIHKREGDSPKRISFSEKVIIKKVADSNKTTEENMRSLEKSAPPKAWPRRDGIVVKRGRRKRLFDVFNKKVHPVSERYRVARSLEIGGRGRFPLLGEERYIP